MARRMQPQRYDEGAKVRHNSVFQLVVKVLPSDISEYLVMEVCRSTCNQVSEQLDVERIISFLIFSSPELRGASWLGTTRNGRY
jgi:hypothetical protein